VAGGNGNKSLLWAEAEPRQTTAAAVCVGGTGAAGEYGEINTAGTANQDIDGLSD